MRSRIARLGRSLENHIHGAALGFLCAITHPTFWRVLIDGTVAVLLVCGAIKVYERVAVTLDSTTGVLTETKGVLTDTRKVLVSTDSLLKDVKDSADDNYWDVKATLGSVATTAHDMDDFVLDFRAALMGGKDSHGIPQSGLIEEARLLLYDGRKLAQDMDASLKRLTDSGDAVLKPLATTLQNIASLTQTLDTEVKTSSPKARETADQLTKALADLDKLFADPNIQKSLAHVEDSTESIAAGLRPWREKAHLLKTVLGKAIEFIKFTIKL